MFKDLFSGRSETSQQAPAPRSSSGRKKSSSHRAESAVSLSSRKPDDEKYKKRSERFTGAYDDTDTISSRGPAHVYREIESQQPGLTESALRTLSNGEDWEDEEIEEMDSRSERRSRRSDHGEQGRRRKSKKEQGRSRSRSRDVKDRNDKRKKDLRTTPSSKTSRSEDSKHRRGESSRAIPDMGSFDQFPGQYNSGMAGSEHDAMMSGALPASAPAQQFPGQVSSGHSRPAQPPMGPRRGESYGEAAEYYLDQGESVSHQPGHRPSTPNMLVNPDHHLIAASAEAQPVADTGHGSAADFYSGKASPVYSSQPITSEPLSMPVNGAQSSSNRPSKTSKISGGTAAAALGAIGSIAALGKASQHQSSIPQQHTSTSFQQNGASSGAYSSEYISKPQSKPDRHTSDGNIYYGRPPSSYGTTAPGKQPTNSNIPLYAVGATAAAGIAAHGMHGRSDHTQAHYSSHDMAAADGPGGVNGLQRPPRPHQALDGPNGGLDHHGHFREQKGPMTRLKDGLLNLVSTPEDVAKMEIYTEYIGVCKHCFDPRTSAWDAPRVHHHHSHRRDSFESLRKRRSMERNLRRGSNESLRRTDSSRVDKDHRYYASESSRQRRQSSKTDLLGAGMAAVGVVAGANALSGARKNFDDTYSVKSGHRESSAIRRRSRSSSHERRRRTSHGVIRSDAGEAVYVRSKDGKLERRRTSRHSRSSSRDGRSASGFGIGAVTGTALGAAAVSGGTRRRSRSHERRSPMRSSRYSDSRHARTTESDGLFASFFSPPEKKRRGSREHRKKSRGFFTFSNGSSSSSNSDLAFGGGSSKTRQPLRRKSSIRTTKKRSDEHIAATVAGISATAAALAAAQRGQKLGKRSSRPELGARKEVRIQTAAPTHRQGSPGPSDEEEWEDELPSAVDSASSVDAGLAFGNYSGKLSNRQSMESVGSQSSGDGLSAWGWRWGGKDKRKAPRTAGGPVSYPSNTTHPLTGPGGVAVDASGKPLKAANNTRLDDTGRRLSSANVSSTSIPRQPMQYVDPRPLSDNGSLPGSRHPSMPGSFEFDESVPIGRPGPGPIQQPQPIAPKQATFTQSSPEMPKPRRADSAPVQSSFAQDAALIGGAALATAGIIAGASGKRSKEPANVQFNLTEEQQRKHDEERRRSDRTRALKEEAERTARESRQEEIRRAREDENRKAAQARLEREQALDREREERESRDRASRQREEAERERQRGERLDRERVAAEAAAAVEAEHRRRREAEEAAAIEHQRQDLERRNRENAYHREQAQYALQSERRAEDDKRRREDGERERDGRRQAEQRRGDERGTLDKRSSSGWGAVAGVAAGATAAAVLAGREHQGRREPEIRNERRIKSEREAEEQHAVEREAREQAKSDRRRARDRSEEEQHVADRQARAQMDSDRERRERYGDSDVEIHNGFAAKEIKPKQEAERDTDQAALEDPDYFKRSEDRSTSRDRYDDLARKATERIMNRTEDYSADDWIEDRKEAYADRTTQAAFFAPDDITSKREPGTKEKAGPPAHHADNEIQVYQARDPVIRSHFHPSNFDNEYVARTKSRFAPYGVPGLYASAPTPPPDAWASNRNRGTSEPTNLSRVQTLDDDDPTPVDEIIPSIPSEPLSRVHSLADDEPTPPEPTTGKSERSKSISWGEDKTHIYHDQTPEYREGASYISSPQVRAINVGDAQDRVIVEDDEGKKRQYNEDQFKKTQPQSTRGRDVEEITREQDRQQPFYRQPFYDSVSDIGVGPFQANPLGTKGVPPVQGFVEGETDEPTPAEEKARHVPGGFDDEFDDLEPVHEETAMSNKNEPSPSKKESKKNKKMRGKASEQQSAVENDPLSYISQLEPALAEKDGVKESEVNEDSAEFSLSKKDRKKRDQAAKRQSITGSDSPMFGPETGPASLEDNSSRQLENQDEPVMYSMSKKDRKKRDKAARQRITVDDEPSVTPLETEGTRADEDSVTQIEAQEEPAEYFTSKKDRKKRDKALKRGTSDVATSREDSALVDVKHVEAEEPPIDSMVDFEQPRLSKKEQKKLEKEAKRSGGFVDVANAMMTTAGIAAVAGALPAQEDSGSGSSSNKKSKGKKIKLGEPIDRDIRDTELAIEASPVMQEPPSAESSHMPGGWDEDVRHEPENNSPDIDTDDITAPAGPRDEPWTDFTESKKKKKTSSKRNSAALGAMPIGSPLRSEVAQDDYIDSLRSSKGVRNMQELEHLNGHENGDGTPVRHEQVSDEGQHNGGSIRDSSPDRAAQSAFEADSADIGKRRQSQRAESREAGDYGSNAPYPGEEEPMVSSEPVEPYETSAKSKRRSRYDDDDAVSVTSSKSRRERDMSPPRKKEKEKKSGILGGLFSRKSSEGAPLSRESTRESKSSREDEDDERRRRRKKHHKESEPGDDDDTRSMKSGSRPRQHSLDQSEVERETRRESIHDDIADTRSEGGHRHHRRRRTEDEFDVPRNEERRHRRPEEIESGNPRDESFLGMRVEDMPPLPDSPPVSPALAAESQEQGHGTPVSAELDTDLVNETKPSREVVQQLPEPHIAQTVADETRHDGSESTTEEDPQDLPPLPGSRPESPSILTATPVRPLPVRPASATTVPLRFPFGHGSSTPLQHSKERTANANSPIIGSSPNSPIAGPKGRHGARPGSTEIREFRPLYLVERNRKTPEVEDRLPSLPSSKTTSRASSVHGSDEYQSAAEDWESPQSRRALSINTDHANAALRHDEDFLDSEQNTPKASEFGPTLPERPARQKPQYYTWEDFAREEQMHNEALQTPPELPSTESAIRAHEAPGNLEPSQSPRPDVTASKLARVASRARSESPSRHLQGQYKGIAAAAMLGTAAVYIGHALRSPEHDRFLEEQIARSRDQSPASDARQIGPFPLPLDRHLRKRLPDRNKQPESSIEDSLGIMETPDAPAADETRQTKPVDDTSLADAAMLPQTSGPIPSGDDAQTTTPTRKNSLKTKKGKKKGSKKQQADDEKISTSSSVEALPSTSQTDRRNIDAFLGAEAEIEDGFAAEFAESVTKSASDKEEAPKLPIASVEVGLDAHRGTNLSALDGKDSDFFNQEPQLEGLHSPTATNRSLRAVDAVPDAVHGLLNSRILARSPLNSTAEVHGTTKELSSEPVTFSDVEQDTNDFFQAEEQMEYGETDYRRTEQASAGAQRDAGVALHPFPQDVEVISQATVAGSLDSPEEDARPGAESNWPDIEETPFERTSAVEESATSLPSEEVRSTIASQAADIEQPTAVEKASKLDRKQSKKAKKKRNLEAVQSSLDFVMSREHTENLVEKQDSQISPKQVEFRQPVSQPNAATGGVENAAISSGFTHADNERADLPLSPVLSSADLSDRRDRHDTDLDTSNHRDLVGVSNNSWHDLQAQAPRDAILDKPTSGPIEPPVLAQDARDQTFAEDVAQDEVEDYTSTSHAHKEPAKAAMPQTEPDQRGSFAPVLRKKSKKDKKKKPPAWSDTESPGARREEEPYAEASQQSIQSPSSRTDPAIAGLVAAGAAALVDDNLQNSKLDDSQRDDEYMPSLSRKKSKKDKKNKKQLASPSEADLAPPAQAFMLSEGQISEVTRGAADKMSQEPEMDDSDQGPQQGDTVQKLGVMSSASPSEAVEPHPESRTTINSKVSTGEEEHFAPTISRKKSKKEKKKQRQQQTDDWFETEGNLEQDNDVVVADGAPSTVAGEVHTDAKMTRDQDLGLAHEQEVKSPTSHEDRRLEFSQEEAQRDPSIRDEVARNSPEDVIAKHSDMPSSRSETLEDDPTSVANKSRNTTVPVTSLPEVGIVRNTLVVDDRARESREHRRGGAEDIQMLDSTPELRDGSVDEPTESSTQKRGGTVGSKDSPSTPLSAAVDLERKSDETEPLRDTAPSTGAGEVPDLHLPDLQHTDQRDVPFDQFDAHATLVESRGTSPDPIAQNKTAGNSGEEEQTTNEPALDGIRSLPLEENPAQFSWTLSSKKKTKNAKKGLRVSNVRNGVLESPIEEGISLVEPPPVSDPQPSHGLIEHDKPIEDIDKAQKSYEPEGAEEETESTWAFPSLTGESKTKKKKEKEKRTARGIANPTECITPIDEPDAWAAESGTAPESSVDAPAISGQNIPEQNQMDFIAQYAESSLDRQPYPREARSIDVEVGNYATKAQDPDIGPVENVESWAPMASKAKKRKGKKQVMPWINSTADSESEPSSRMKDMEASIEQDTALTDKNNDPPSTTDEMESARSEDKAPPNSKDSSPPGTGHLEMSLEQAAPLTSSPSGIVSAHEHASTTPSALLQEDTESFRKPSSANNSKKRGNKKSEVALMPIAGSEVIKPRDMSMEEDQVTNESGTDFTGDDAPKIHDDSSLDVRRLRSSKSPETGNTESTFHDNIHDNIHGLEGDHALYIDDDRTTFHSVLREPPLAVKSMQTTSGIVREQSVALSDKPDCVYDDSASNSGAPTDEARPVQPLAAEAKDIEPPASSSTASPFQHLSIEQEHETPVGNEITRAPADEDYTPGTEMADERPSTITMDEAEPLTLATDGVDRLPVDDVDTAAPFTIKKSKRDKKKGKKNRSSATVPWSDTLASGTDEGVNMDSTARVSALALGAGAAVMVAAADAADAPSVEVEQDCEEDERIGSTPEKSKKGQKKARVVTKASLQQDQPVQSTLRSDEATRDHAELTNTKSEGDNEAKLDDIPEYSEFHDAAPDKESDTTSLNHSAIAADPPTTSVPPSSSEEQFDRSGRAATADLSSIVENQDKSLPDHPTMGSGLGHEEHSVVESGRHPTVELTEQESPREQQTEHNAHQTPSHDIDFAATVAAGLADSGFDPNLVIQDAGFQRRASPPGVAEADPEEFWHAPPKRKRGKGLRNSRESTQALPEDFQESTFATVNNSELERDFDKTIAQGLSATGFDPVLLEQAQASSADASPHEGSEVTDVPFAIHKRRNAKSRKPSHVSAIHQESLATPAAVLTIDKAGPDLVPRPHSIEAAQADRVGEAARETEPSPPMATHLDTSPKPSSLAAVQPAETLVSGHFGLGNRGEMDVDEMDKRYKAYKKNKRKEKKSKAVAMAKGGEAHDMASDVPATGDDTQTSAAVSESEVISSSEDPQALLTSNGNSTDRLAIGRIDSLPEAAEHGPDRNVAQGVEVTGERKDPSSPQHRVQSIFPGLERVKRAARLTTSIDEPSSKHRRSLSRKGPEGFIHTSEVSQSLPFAVGGSSPVAEKEVHDQDFLKEELNEDARGYTHDPQEQESRLSRFRVAGAGLIAAGAPAAGRASREENSPDRESKSTTSRTLQENPSWSFDALQHDDTIPVSPSLASKEQQIARDSGYQDGHNSADHRIPEIHTSASRESLRSRRSLEPLRISPSPDHAWDIRSVKQRSGNNDTLKSEQHPRTPSEGTPLDPTSKNRASYLFTSPPGYSPIGAHLPESPYVPPPSQRPEAADYFKPRSTSEEAPAESERISRAGASMLPLSPGPFSPRVPLNPIPEEHHASKRSKHASDIGGPDNVKAIDRTETPQAIRAKHRQLNSPVTRPTVTIPGSTPRAVGNPLSTDELINRLSWPAVDEERDTINIHRSLPRKAAIMPTHRSPSTNSHRSTSSGAQFRSPEEMRSYSRSSNRSGTPSLRRISLSGDLRAASRRGDSGSAVGSRSSPRTIPFEPPPTPPSNDEDVIESSASRAAAMDDIFQGYGDAQRSQTSPSRPPSVRKRQSMHISDLEFRLDQLVAENQALHEARQLAEQSRSDPDYDVNIQETLRTRDLEVQAKDAEIKQLRLMLEPLQEQIHQLTEHNEGLTQANRNLVDDTNGRYATLQSEHAHAHEQWQSTSRELDIMRQKHGRLASGMRNAVEAELATALADKNAEILRLREQLDIAAEQIRALQVQIQSSKSGDFLLVRDEDYFDGTCQKLCQHVQQWVLRFSKISDNHVCRLSTELHDDKLEARLDNAILDGSDVDKLLGDRVRRRDVFMSVVMTMVWEYIFTRYLFGMDREQRQKLKALEKVLAEVGPVRAIAQWRATTLALLAKRPAFAQQCNMDTEAVSHEIFNMLCALLPPPTSAEEQLLASLQKVIKIAVDLSIEMRTQRAEYIMLPPLQPEYDTNGDLVRKVHFNAQLMNERSGLFSSNEELAADHAVVKVVLFPLVVKKGDDYGEGEEEIVVCPAQVLIHNESGKGKRVVRVMSGAMEIDSPARHRQSRQSLFSEAPGSVAF